MARPKDQPLDRLKCKVWFAQVQYSLKVNSSAEVALKLGDVKKIKAAKDTPEDSTLRNFRNWESGSKKCSAEKRKQIENKVEKIAGAEAKALCQHVYIFGPFHSQLWACINFHDDPSTRPYTKIGKDNLILNLPSQPTTPKNLLNLSDATACYFVALEALVASLGVKDNLITYLEGGSSLAEGNSKALGVLRDENFRRYASSVRNIFQAANEASGELIKINVKADYFLDIIEKQARWLVNKHLPRYAFFCNSPGFCLVDLNLRQFCSTTSQKNTNKQEANINDENGLSSEDINDMYDSICDGKNLETSLI